MKSDGVQNRIGDAQRLLKAMASEPRLLILYELLHNEQTVTELQQSVGIAMSAVSQHLAKLRKAEIVVALRESQSIRYRLSSVAAEQLMTTLYAMFCAPQARGGKRRKQ
jgi:DNA-binding transcriptional ArsR family regulator